MSRGKSKSIAEMELLIKKVEEKLAKQKYKSISQACINAEVPRKSYYHYKDILANSVTSNKLKQQAISEALGSLINSDQIVPQVILDKRALNKKHFHETGQQFLYEFSILCPILSTRTLHKLYNEFFVPDYNRRLQLLKNPPEPKIPNVKNGDKLIERTKQRNKCLARINSNVKEVWPESYFRINNKIKQMGLIKEEVRREKAYEILKPIVEEKLKERYLYINDQGILDEEKRSKREWKILKRGYNVETFSIVLIMASNSIQLQSIDLDLHMLGWLKDYASRNPKKTAGFLVNLFGVKDKIITGFIEDIKSGNLTEIEKLKTKLNTFYKAMKRQGDDFYQKGSKTVKPLDEFLKNPNLQDDNLPKGIKSFDDFEKMIAIIVFKDTRVKKGGGGEWSLAS